MLDRSAVQRSVEAAAALVDPETQQRGGSELDAALRDAIRESARVEARSRWWPFVERTDLEAWSRAASLAAARSRDVRQRRAQLENEWSVALSRAEEMLDDVMSHPLRPPSPRASAGARKAALELDVARSFAREGRYPDALLAAARSIEASEAVLDERDRRLARFYDPENLRLWREWVQGTVRDSQRTRSTAIVVDKLRRRLYLYESGRVSLTFDVELGSGALARKLHQGDHATPEGRYRVTEVRGPRATAYHRALMIDYPSEEDRRRFSAARAKGEIPARSRIGGLIEIHGQGGQGGDWTEGCVALSNDEMDRLVRRVRIGTPVTIVGRIP